MNPGVIVLEVQTKFETFVKEREESTQEKSSVDFSESVLLRSQCGSKAYIIDIATSVTRSSSTPANLDIHRQQKH